jgi:transposase-like protein
VVSIAYDAAQRAIAYIKIKGQWKYRYRVVDKAGQTVDCLLTVHRDNQFSRK